MQRSNSRQLQTDQGFVVVATAMSIFVLIGMMGLALDLGRLFIFKSEAQAFADVEALAAARLLDGTADGLEAARASVLGSGNRLHFNTQGVPAAVTTVEFAQSAAGPWQANPPGSAVGFGFVRVTVRPEMQLLVMSAVTARQSVSVTGEAVAAQVPQTFPAGGYVPFSPYALTASDPSGNFGMTVGQEYAFLWPGNAKKQNVCVGNQVNWPAYDFSDNSMAGGSERGYFEFQSAAEIADAVMGLKQTTPLAIGDVIQLTNGRKQSTSSELEDRAALDTDLTEFQPSASGTAPDYQGNGMRLVIMPINGGSLSTPQNKVVGFGAFLLPLTYPNGGNKTWCAIYAGSRVTGGTQSAYSGAGAYEVRLVH